MYNAKLNININSYLFFFFSLLFLLLFVSTTLPFLLLLLFCKKCTVMFVCACHWHLYKIIVANHSIDKSNTNTNTKQVIYNNQYAILMIPPSTLNALPLIPEASSLLKYKHAFAISRGSKNFCFNEFGSCSLK